MSFTVWHYLAIIIIMGLLIWSIVYTLQQNKLSSKGSFIATYVVAAFALLSISFISIDQQTQKVILLNFQNHRLLSTEQIIFTGSVRNVGDYTVSEVEIEIKIFDKGIKKQGRPLYESTAFRDAYGLYDSDNQPKSFVIRQKVVTDLEPGHSKRFVMAVDYPSHFKGFTDKARLITH